MMVRPKLLDKRGEAGGWAVREGGELGGQLCAWLRGQEMRNDIL
jgi:hypothetical protein